MRKEELDRRCAEMKANMLAQRAAQAQEQSPKVTGRKAARRAERDHGSSTIQTTDLEDVSALKKQIAQLEAENKSLRQQLAGLTSSAAAQSPRSGEDSVREQRHNFFKYSNVRRY